jgi:Arc/MetJ-type ribon-helix-helix transcriptional regulator
MHRIQVQLTDEQEQALRDLAALREASVSALIREGVDLLLASSLHLEQRKKALEMIGAYYDSGLTDVSVNHDKYLADIYAQIAEE